MLAGLLLCAFGAPAVTAGENDFSWRGFGTAGIAYNPGDDFEFVRDLTQGSGARNEATAKVDSNLGIQLRYRLRPDLDGVVQVVSRHDQDGSLPAELNWAYLKYTPSPTWEFYAGRTSWDIFMLSDNRNVGYSYLWVRPPIEFFGLQQISHLDGLDAVGTWPLGDGVLWFKLYGGYADEKLPIGGGESYDLSGSQVLGGHVNFRSDNWWFRLGLADVELDNALESLQPLLGLMRGGSGNRTSAKLADDMQLEKADVWHAVAGVVYQRGPFQAQLMFDRTTSETLLFPDLNSGFVSLSYRAGDWMPYLSFAGAETEEVDRDSGFPAGSPPDRAIQSTLRSAQIDQHTTSIGVRYDFRSNMALKLQVDRLRADGPNASLARDAEPTWNGVGTVFTATLDFVF